MSFHPPPKLMKLLNNLQLPLSPPKNFENNIFLSYNPGSSYFTIILCNESNFYLPADAVDDDLQKISGHLQGDE